ncbi:MbcA/ParS/Xre antitoxin family protein [Salinarimonas chemoclinalis]|uniref:MbcA/ParS/Xre antitoxin family protein n=1 Tax=Salinarimonas chemoclinalis TaxID=3241599 RepID=UPI0035592B1F
MAVTARAAPSPDPGIVLTKAVVKAAARLGLSARALARVIGVSEPTVSRMKAGAYRLDPGGKPFELAVMLVRLYRSLDAIAGGDDAVSRAWLHGANTDLAGVPAERIASVQGLVDVVAYLDARRARV